MENNLNDKYLKLIDVEEEYSIKKETLNRMVNPDNIKSEQSYQILEKLGGVNSLLSKLNINPLIGLNESDLRDIKKRKQIFGLNEPLVPFTKSFFDCFFQILNQKVFLILIFAATVRLAIDFLENKGRWFDYSSIYLAVLVICLAMSIIEFSKDKVFENFQIEINNKQVRVLRNNEEKLISQKDLLVGDILIINSGEIIPVDGIIIKSYSITIDNEDTLFSYHNIDYTKQNLTPWECDKMEYPFVLSGSNVVKGYGYFLVLCVGLNTYLSKFTQERYKNNSNNTKKSIVNDENRNAEEDEEKEFEIGNTQENYYNDKNIQYNKAVNYTDVRSYKKNFFSNYNNETSYRSEEFSRPTSEIAVELEANNNNAVNYSPYCNKNVNKQLLLEKDNSSKIADKNINQSNLNKTIQENKQNTPYNKITSSKNVQINNQDDENMNNFNTKGNNLSKNSNYDTYRSIFKKSDKPQIGTLMDKNIEASILNHPLTNKNSTRKRISIKENQENTNTEVVKDIVDYAEEFNILNQTRKNIEVKSGFFRNKSMLSLNNFRKKEIVNVRSQDKRYANTEIFYYSPLQKKIEFLEQILSKFGIAASIISGLSLILVYIILTYPDHFILSELIQIIIDALLYGLVLVVLAVPEGLPLVSTLSAAFSINKMREENTIIKSIQACENMATINCICTDFNGVFTKNEMKVTKIFIEDHALDERQIRYLKSEISGDSFDFLCEAISINTIAYAAINDKTLNLEYFGDSVETSLIKYLKDIKINYKDLRDNKRRPILECSSYSAEFNLSYTIIEMDGKYDYVRLYLRGNPEELLDSLNNFITNRETLQPVNPKFKEKIKKFCKDVTKEGELPIFLCYRDIQKEHFYKIRQAYLNRENEFLRTLITQLNLIAIVSMKDEIKEDVKSYIEEFNRAGITIKMVTSQDRETAKIAAEKCGILSQNIIITKDSDDNISFNSNDDNADNFNETANLVKNKLNYNNNVDEKIRNYLNNRPMNNFNNKNKVYNSNSVNNSFCEIDILDCHEDLKKLIDLKLKKKNLSNTNSYHSFEFLINDINKFEQIIQNSKVISKATAKDKYILVSTLKKNGYIVAVTGDSVSDYLAMKSAQVSISMGFKASDMSKESADIILCDNSFKNILTGIIYGRNIYNSVRKFIQFQITATISIITLALVCSLPFINFYFYPNQLLWLNLVMDTFGSISLASEQPIKEEVLYKKPYSNKKNIVSKTMKLRIIVQAIFQISIIMFMVFLSPVVFHIESDRNLKHINWEPNNGIHTTFVFTCLVYMQFFNAFISRNLDKNNLNIFKNLSNHRIFLTIQSFMIILHYVIITYGNRLTRSKPLSILNHISCFLISSIVLLSLPIIKYLSRNFKIDFLR